MAFPYVSTTVDEKLEDSLLSGFAENCNGGFERKRVTYTDTCTVGQDLKKHRSMDSVRVSCYLYTFGSLMKYLFCTSTTCTLQDLVTSRMGNNPSGQTDLIVFCNGGFEDLNPVKSEG
jgi:hypothetical protein